MISKSIGQFHRDKTGGPGLYYSGLMRVFNGYFGLFTENMIYFPAY